MQLNLKSVITVSPSVHNTASEISAAFPTLPTFHSLASCGVLSAWRRSAVCPCTPCGRGVVEVRGWSYRLSSLVILFSYGSFAEDTLYGIRNLSVLWMLHNEWIMTSKSFANCTNISQDIVECSKSRALRQYWELIFGSPRNSIDYINIFVSVLRGYRFPEVSRAFFNASKQMQGGKPNSSSKVSFRILYNS
jgi:hypothetical protein